MKKAVKIILSLIFLLLIIGAGTAYYFLKVKTYDIADEEVEEIAESEYEIILPEDIDAEPSETEGDSETQTEGDAANNNDEQPESSTDQNHQTPSSSRGTPNEDPVNGGQNKESGATVASIKQKYTPSFEHLESQANSKIDALVSQAYGEFQEKQKNGESISLPYFYQKYSTAASALEGNTDAAFNQVLGALKNELQANGFSASHADSFAEQYEAQKKAREDALLNKIKEAL